MGSTSDKVKGTANQAIGKVGKALARRRRPALKGEGKLQEAKGTCRWPSARPRLP